MFFFIIAVPLAIFLEDSGQFGLCLSMEEKWL